jgi:two-component system sensor histidine kinase MprB
VSLRARIAVLVAVTVAAILIVVGAGLQAITSATLIGAVDEDLRAIAANLERDPRGALVHAGPGRDRLGGAIGIVQLVGEQGPVRLPPGRAGMLSPEQTVDLPVGEEVLAIVRGEAGASLRTVELDDVRFRILAAPIAERFAVQVARPLDEVDAVVAALRVRTALISLAGALLAAILAWFVAGHSIRPVRELTEAVESVRDGQDLSRRAVARAGGDRNDEVARLASAFAAMLARLDASRIAQDQLAADASHELRTPLTSLRVNVEVLARDAERLAPADRARLTDDVIIQLEELTGMVDGLVELARVDTGQVAWTSVDLEGLLHEVVDAAVRRYPHRAADLSLVLPGAGATGVQGDRSELLRAVTAMVENAVKYAEAGPISIGLSPSTDVPDRLRVWVRDAGPGVDAEDLSRLFDRFYRAPEARGRAGAGLGLALVERVVRAHGGTVRAENVTPHGLEVSLELPTSGRAPSEASGV